MRPEYLKAGDRVALIAPARAVSREEMQPFRELMQAWGLELVEGKHLYLREGQFSGSDVQRFADLREAWNDASVKAVFCARGGYGSMRFLHLAETELDTRKSKWLVGFSDISSLQFYLHNKGIPSIHGPMAFNAAATHGQKEENFARLRQALFGETLEYDLSDCEVLNPAPVKAEILGGNLSLLYASLGTPEQLDLRGKVLFIEDLDEYLYHIDRMMQSLKRAGALDGLAGLIVGQMLDMKDNAIPFGRDCRQIIEEVCGDMGYPIVFGFPAGHGEKNYCFKQGCVCTFDPRSFQQQA